MANKLVLLLVFGLCLCVPVQAEEWLIFEELDAEECQFNGKPRGLGVFGANHEGRRWILFFLQGGRIIDTSREGLFVVSKSDLIGLRGTIKADLDTMRAIPDSGYTFTDEGEYTRVEAWWGSRRVEFVILKREGE